MTDFNQKTHDTDVGSHGGQSRQMMEVFENQEFGSIRVLQEAGKTFFCASDVAKALGYVNPYAAVKRHSTTPEAVETQPTQEATETEETTSRDDTGVYPNATGLTEVAMGVTEDICTFKVPLNYVLAGGYYDENNEEHTIQGLNSATTTVEEALAAGSFSTGNHLAFFTMTSLDADQTMITTGMYTPDIMSWDDFKAYYTDAKEIGDESVPGLLYHVEAISGQCVSVAVKVSDDVTLQIVYEGSLEGEIGEDELGQRLYELVTVK